MPIDESQMHPLFRPLDLEDKQRKQKEKTWKALYYTLRSLLWKEACKNLRNQGLADGSLIYDQDGEVTTVDGQPLTRVFDEYRPEFDESYDRAFARATAKELVEYATRKFGMDYNELMRLNEERMSQYRGRAPSKPIPPSIDINDIHF